MVPSPFSSLSSLSSILSGSSPSVRIFFHPLPECAKLENILARPNLHTGGGELGVHHRNYLEEMKITAASIHEALEEYRVPERENADWVYIPTWFPFFFWVRSADSLSCANETLTNLDFGENYGLDFLVSYPHDYPVFDADRLWEHNLRAYTPYADNKSSKSCTFGKGTDPKEGSESA